ncbi:MAG: helix-turn-helix domain-containing protein, partial [Erysipelotrichales bacterium]|nr:helix-turn-helix domain-containing protein [Erysipelotrichales bacterium]
MELGNKIKELRVKNNLTLEELASRCELTKGFLSQLERDLTSPSISTLEDILEALGTTLAEFFQTKQDEQLVFTNDDHFVDEREGYTVSWIVPNALKNEMEPIILDIKPKQSSFIMEPHE